MEESKFQSKTGENASTWQEWFNAHGTNLGLCIAMFLLTIISFNLGRLSALKPIRPTITVTGEISSENQKKAQIGAVKKALTRDYATEEVVASKKSTSKAYHFSWCSGSAKISIQNQLTFPNEAAAITAGYTLAGNCQKR